MKFRSLRNLLFYALLIPITIIFAILSISFCWLPFSQRYALITRWSYIFIFLCRKICGLNYKIMGMEHIPKTPCVILCKHQSAWETIFCQLIFPPQCIVLKKELLNIPFFGWGLRLLEPIALDRKQLSSARQVVDQGMERLKKGRWVLIFPEGTRVPHGGAGRYSRTGAALALASQCPIIPLAHNAGFFWPKGWFIRQSGTILITIGEPIHPQGSSAEVMTQVSHWIERAAMIRPISVPPLVND